MRNRGGFTLIELLMAVVIIGILITIAVPTYTDAVERSKKSQALSNLKAIRKAELAFHSQNDTYGSLSELDTSLNANFNSLSNADWNYTLLGKDFTTFTIAATRLRGRHKSSVIRIDHADSWAGDYPLSL